jgi:hypothetical protein
LEPRTSLKDDGSKRSAIRETTRAERLHARGDAKGWQTRISESVFSDVSELGIGLKGDGEKREAFYEATLSKFRHARGDAKGLKARISESVIPNALELGAFFKVNRYERGTPFEAGRYDCNSVFAYRRVLWNTRARINTAQDVWRLRSKAYP